MDDAHPPSMRRLVRRGQGLSPDQRERLTAMRDRLDREVYESLSAKHPGLRHRLVPPERVKEST